MGRRRTPGQVRSAGAGRPCPHPPHDREYQLGHSPDHERQRCRRCGQILLLEDSPRCTVLTCIAPASTWLRKSTTTIAMPYCSRHAADRLLGGWLDAEAPTP